MRNKGIEAGHAVELLARVFFTEKAIFYIPMLAGTGYDATGRPFRKKVLSATTGTARISVGVKTRTESTI